ncbi:MAG: aldo/keto reductase [Anaerolineae bacterium]|nr:aldo/keto reductase [Anaerolineae bacterium]NUQ04250.1 aldo/keto reductase [Anaerolineae bacterium]
MDYVSLGKTGLKVSRLCLGCMTYGTPAWRDWVLDEAASRPFFVRALEAGITFFDTADVYSLGVSEEITGRALRDLTKRDQVVIATKVFSTMGESLYQRGLSRKWIMQSIDNSLRRLGTDYVDLYQIHRFDPETPIEETMEALHDVVKAGKARYIGASSMYAWQFAQMQHAAERHGWTKFIAMQNHYNLVYREEEREMIPFCRDQGVGVIPWSPLARGFLAGRRTREAPETARSRTDDYAHRMYYHPADYDVVDAVVTLAEARGVKPIQIALAWVLHKPGITAPIIGVSKMPQFDELLAALEIRLSAEEIAVLEAPYQPHPILGH